MATPDFIPDEEVSNYISDEEALLLESQGTNDFIPDDKADEFFKEETPIRGKNTTANAFQDIARFFAPLATTGLNAIGTAIGEKAGGGSFTEGLTKGAQSEEFLGMGLGMETTAGKYVEKYLGDALQSVRNFGGENAPKLLTNDASRTILKGLPGTAALVNMYESLPKAGKTAVEAALSAGGASAPELLLTLVGGKAAKNLEKPKVKAGDEGLLDIINEVEKADTPEASGIIGQTSDMFPETLGESPFGATPDQISKWDVDENGMPIDRQATQELQATEMQPFNDMLETQAQRDLFGQQTSQGIYEQPRSQGIAEPTANLKGEGDVFEGYTPDNLIEFEKGIQSEMGLDFPIDNKGVDFSTSGNPEGGAFLRDRTITDTTDRTNAPYKADYAQDMFGIEKPLGATGFGKSQGGAINLGAFLPEKKPKALTEQAKTLSKEEWIKAFKAQYPEKSGIADQVYDKLGEKQVGTTKANRDSSGVLSAVDTGLGSLSTRIGNISQPLLHRAMKFEQGVLENTHNRLTSIDDFSVAAHNLPKSSRDILDNAILNNDAAKLDAIFNKLGGKFKSDYNKARKSLDEVGKELQAVGRLSGLRQDYFPRVVKDIDGLLGALGTEKASLLKTQLMKAQSPLEEMNVVNNYLRRNYKTQYKPGFSKERKIDEVPPELQQFYATPTEAYHTYMRNATQEIETAKFFGRNAIKDGQTGRVDINQSIGNLVLNEIKAGKVSFKEADTLQEMLQARFTGGNRSSNKWIQDAKNIGYMGLLGDAISAATQLADPAISIYANGLRPTLQSLVVQLIPKMKDEVHMKDFGLLDHISEEFVNDRTTARVLNKVFKYGLFTAVDSMGKNVVLNSSLRNARNQVKSSKGLVKFADEWQERFGDEFPQLVTDLQSGVLSEPVKTMLFSKLAKVQPITKLEMPQKYLEMPNGRIIYMLKTFMLKQADLLRNESYNKIKSKGTRTEGINNLIRYSVIMGLAGAGTEEVKNWLLGKDSKELELSDIPLNMLKSFGLSQFVMDKVKAGNVGEAAGGVVLPPYKMYDPVFQDISNAFDGDEDTEPSYKGVQRIPLFGRFVYNWLMGGAEEYNEKLLNEED